MNCEKRGKLEIQLTIFKREINKCSPIGSFDHFNVDGENGMTPT